MPDGVSAPSYAVSACRRPRGSGGTPLQSLVLATGSREHETNDVPPMSPVCVAHLFGRLLEFRCRCGEPPAVAVVPDETRPFHPFQLGGCPAGWAAECDADLFLAPRAVPLGMEQDQEIELSH